MDDFAIKTKNGEDPLEAPGDGALLWLESVLPRIMRRLMDSENLDMPLLQLPLAQMRLAQALYSDDETEDLASKGDIMGRLSERLGVRQNALTQAADRLVNHELAERLSDPTDRRVVRLRLTARGRDWVHERRERRRHHLSRLWEMLDSNERAEFLHAVNVLEAVAGRLNMDLDSNLAGNSLHGASSQQSRPARQELPTIEETLSRFTAGAANGASARIKA
jgi:DNA-binding MarR family transcriptional regulator